MKRFLAFSSIAQVGFILIGITGQSAEGSASVIYFILIYIFSNLAAFGVINLISAVTGRENVDDYKGFYKTNKGLAWVLAIALFSLGAFLQRQASLVNSFCCLQVQVREIIY
jgi:NADH-quinone oxidoreductase subunit N